MKWLNKPKQYSSSSCSTYDITCYDFCPSHSPDDGCAIRYCSGRGTCDSNVCIAYLS